MSALARDLMDASNQSGERLAELQSQLQSTARALEDARQNLTQLQSKSDRADETISQLNKVPCFSALTVFSRSVGCVICSSASFHGMNLSFGVQQLEEERQKHVEEMSAADTAHAQAVALSDKECAQLKKEYDEQTSQFVEAEASLAELRTAFEVSKVRCCD